MFLFKKSQLHRTPTDIAINKFNLQALKVATLACVSAWVIEKLPTSLYQTYTLPPATEVLPGDAKYRRVRYLAAANNLYHAECTWNEWDGNKIVVYGSRPKYDIYMPGSLLFDPRTRISSLFPNRDVRNVKIGNRTLGNLTLGNLDVETRDAIISSGGPMFYLPEEVEYMLSTQFAAREYKMNDRLYPRLLTGILPGWYFGSLAGGIKLWIRGTKYPIDRTINVAFGLYPTVGIAVGMYWAWTFWSQRLYGQMLDVAFEEIYKNGGDREDLKKYLDVGVKLNNSERLHNRVLREKWLQETETEENVLRKLKLATRAMLITTEGNDLLEQPPWLTRVRNVLEYKYSDIERFMTLKEWKEKANIPTGREEAETAKHH